MKKPSFLDSFRFALEGLSFVIKNQKNMRIHILLGTLIILLGFIIKVSSFEMAILFLAIMFVIVCEVINTALELSIDFVNSEKYHPLIRLVKDIVAAGVLLASLNAIVVGLFIFFPYFIKGIR